jgi:ABC-type lipoprotein release transport system permease subunit
MNKKLNRQKKKMRSIFWKTCHVPGSVTVIMSVISNSFEQAQKCFFEKKNPHSQVKSKNDYEPNQNSCEENQQQNSMQRFISSQQQEHFIYF